MDLVGEALDVLGTSQAGLELLDVLLGLVAGREHDEGDRDGLGVLGVDHGRVDGGEDAEGVGELVGDEGGDLASPAVLRTLARHEHEHEHERSECECDCGVGMKQVMYRRSEYSQWAIMGKQSSVRNKKVSSAARPQNERSEDKKNLRRGERSG